MKKRTVLRKLQKLDALPLPEKEKILSVCDRVVPETAPAEAKARPKLRRFSSRKVAVLAMAAILLVGGGVTVAAAEAKEYKAAIDFFEEYKLSAEGFTRSEIKKIYRDIVSESFTYEKTEAALASGLEGYEIQSTPLDSEGLRRVWMVGYRFGVEPKDFDESAQYEYSWVHEEGMSTGALYQKKDGELQWSIHLSDIGVSMTEAIDDKVVVVGHPLGQTNNADYTVRMCLINEDSTQVWRKDYPCPLPNPIITYVLCEDDAITVFAFEFPYKKLWIATMDMEGNLINEEFIDFNLEYAVFNKVVSVGDDYLISTSEGLVRKQGNKLEELKTFGNNDEDYYFTEMVEFNGLIYLSGTMYPKYHNRPGGDEYDQFVEEHSKDGITDEELYQFYSENHTAVLMICDPKTGEPQSFYTIPGAAGSNLSVKDDRLTWNVNRYTKAKSYNNMNYYLSSGYLGDITADVWQYVFAPYGQIVGEKDTGRSVVFEG